MKKVVVGKVEFKGSEIHGMGGFALKKIRKDERIIEYVGEEISKKESERRCLEEDNRYIFQINKKLDIDGDVNWNPARWINHSCDPNAETDVIDDRVYISATRPIEPGEEITYNYNFDLDEYEGYPCNCGKRRCVGFILDEAYWEKLKKLERKKKEKAEKVARNKKNKKSHKKGKSKDADKKAPKDGKRVKKKKTGKK